MLVQKNELGGQSQLTLVMMSEMVPLLFSQVLGKFCVVQSVVHAVVQDVYEEGDGV